MNWFDGRALLLVMMLIAVLTWAASKVQDRQWAEQDKDDPYDWKKEGL